MSEGVNKEMSNDERQEPLVSHYRPQFYTEHPEDGNVSDMDNGDNEDPAVWFNRRETEKKMTNEERKRKKEEQQSEFDKGLQTGLEQRLLEQTIKKTLEKGNKTPEEGNNTKKRRKKGGKIVKKSNFTARKITKKRKTLTFRRKRTTRKSARKSYRNPATK